ncbi:hypothetical protein D3C84_1102620 [compost metagenome]
MFEPARPLPDPGGLQPDFGQLDHLTEIRNTLQRIMAELQFFEITQTGNQSGGIGG